ncbi:hypothetical protein ACRAWD_01500 [Caulobacter segnis]
MQQSKDRAGTAQLFYGKAWPDGPAPPIRAAASSSTPWGGRQLGRLIGPSTARSTPASPMRSATTAHSATIFLEGSNPNDEPWRTFVGQSNHIGENERYGRTFRTGVQLSF